MTLAVLAIVIIIMLILTTITLTVLIGDGGIITKARLSTFGQELEQVKEKVEFKKSSHASQLLKESTDRSFQNFNTDLFIEKFNTNETSKYKVKTTLLREILYARRGYRSEENLNSYDEVDFDDIINSDGTIDNIYVIDAETADGQGETYLWDSEMEIVYKINQTWIGLNVYHSYATAALGIDPTGAEVTYDLLFEDEPQFIGEDFAYYEPDLTGYSKAATKIIYYSQTYLTEVASNSSRELQRSDYIELPITEYIRKGKPRTLLGSEFPVDGQTVDTTETYVFHDYANQVWGNVKTDSSGLECWWVWIPRYAYKVNGKDLEPPMDIKFVDIDNKIAKKQNLPDGYTQHPAFTEKETVNNQVIEKELKGIWMSKYEPSYTNEFSPTGNGCYAPDMTGFDEENTYIEIYDTQTKEYSDGDAVQLEYAIENNLLSKMNSENKIWYDYSNQIWANIKTQANGLESWWVWIPRYAYKIEGSVQETDIIFVDLKNRPMDKVKFGTKLPEGYVVHPAFSEKQEVDGEEKTVKELKGIWMSKYEPSYNAQRDTKISGICYEPDFSGYDEDTTFVIYYSKKYLNAVAEDNTRALQRSDYIELPYSKYVEAGKKAQLNGNEFPENSLGDQEPNENDTYVFYDYANQTWGNIKTTSNGLECWWVWIPRYAYSLLENQTQITETQIVFIDTSNKPIDAEKFGNTLKPIYTPHPAFTEKEIDENNKEKIVKELKGIWMSKYEPSWKATE